MIEERALEIWDCIQAYEAPYPWSVGPTARLRLNALLGSSLPCWEAADAAVVNRRLRSLLAQTLNDGATTREAAGQIYGWIVADWGGVRRGRARVESWSSEALGWHSQYEDAVLLGYADQAGMKRISSWSKVFAFAAPDRHAIYDSRVAVVLNLALGEMELPERFFMPAPNVPRGPNGIQRPNSVARARQRLLGDATLGYRDYLLWLAAVRDQAARRGETLDLLTIESTLFATAPAMAAALEPPVA